MNYNLQEVSENLHLHSAALWMTKQICVGMGHLCTAVDFSGFLSHANLKSTSTLLTKGHIQIVSFVILGTHLVASISPELSFVIFVVEHFLAHAKHSVSTK